MYFMPDIKKMYTGTQHSSLFFKFEKEESDFLLTLKFNLQKNYVFFF